MKAWTFRYFRHCAIDGYIVLLAITNLQTMYEMINDVLHDLLHDCSRYVFISSLAIAIVCIIVENLILTYALPPIRIISDWKAEM